MYACTPSKTRRNLTSSRSPTKSYNMSAAHMSSCLRSYACVCARNVLASLVSATIAALLLLLVAPRFRLLDNDAAAINTVVHLLTPTNYLYVYACARMHACNETRFAAWTHTIPTIILKRYDWCVRTWRRCVRPSVFVKASS